MVIQQNNIIASFILLFCAKAASQLDYNLHREYENP
jgi:hypothetical protein